MTIGLVLFWVASSSAKPFTQAIVVSEIVSLVYFVRLELVCATHSLASSNRYSKTETVLLYLGFLTLWSIVGATVILDQLVVRALYHASRLLACILVDSTCLSRAGCLSLLLARSLQRSFSLRFTHFTSPASTYLNLVYKTLKKSRFSTLVSSFWRRCPCAASSMDLTLRHRKSLCTVHFVG